MESSGPRSGSEEDESEPEEGELEGGPEVTPAKGKDSSIKGSQFFHYGRRFPGWFVAYLFGTVQEMEFKASTKEPGHESFAPNLAGWLNLVQSLSPVDRKQESSMRVDTLWRTLVADSAENEEQAITHSFFEFLCQHAKVLKNEDAEQYRQLSGLMEALRTVDEGRLLPSNEEVDDYYEPGVATSRLCVADHGGDVYPTNESLGDGHFYRGLKKFYKVRKLFRTQRGYLGLGPLDVEVGDQVWLLLGARTPFIMRPTGVAEQEPVLRLVGEAHVHGIMHGEVADKEDVVFVPVVIA